MNNSEAAPARAVLLGRAPRRVRGMVAMVGEGMQGAPGKGVKNVGGLTIGEVVGVTSVSKKTKRTFCHLGPF